MDKNYFFVTLFLAILVVGGTFYLLGSNKTSSNPALDGQPQIGTSQAPQASPNIEATAKPTATGSAQTKMEGLKIEDEKVGTGDLAVAGKKITVNYTGTLTDGTKFDSSYDHGTPFAFNLGAGEVIKGWDQGFAGMKVGGKRKLTIPPELGYGANGAGGVIPPNATLIFEVELLKVE